MLRQILSPTSDHDDLSFNSSCHILQQQNQSLFNTNTSVLSSSLQVPLMELAQHHHHDQQLISLQEQQEFNYQDQVQILTETHICPNCGLKLTYHIKTTHRHQDDLLGVGESQLMRFTCHICSKTFLAKSHVKLPGEQQHLQQLAQVDSQIEMSDSMISVDQTPTHYETSQQEQQQQSNPIVHNKNFSCERCQASFRYRTLLEKHKKIHDVSSGQDKPYSCPRCLMRFETRNLYNHHAKTHKPIVTQTEKPTATISKDAANTSTSSSSAANLNKKSNNSYPCETCAKEFPTIESLSSHKAVHRSRPLICDVCGKGFTHRKYYVVHQRIHTGERPYICQICSKAFTQASTLTVHRRYHTGERPYTCTLCGKGFVTRTIMLNHMKKH